MYGSFYPFNHANVVDAEDNLCIISSECPRLVTKAGYQLCGYCAFPKDQVPVEWHGNYQADALTYLAVHGGITYCHVAGENDDSERQPAVLAARAMWDAKYERHPKEDIMNFWMQRRAAMDRAMNAVPYSHVVFGFDTAHAGDADRDELRDVQHIFRLTREMRDQIAAYAAVIHEWRAAKRAQRIVMIDEIRKLASPSLPGFGLMVGMMGGAAEFGPEENEA